MHRGRKQTSMSWHRLLVSSQRNACSQGTVSTFFSLHDQLSDRRTCSSTSETFATNLRVPWCSTLNADNPLAMRAVRGSNDHSLVRLTAQQQRRAIVEGTIELVLLGNHGLAQRLLPPHEHVVRQNCMACRNEDSNCRGTLTRDN